MQPTLFDQIKDARKNGVEQILITTERPIKLRPVEPAALLREGDLPDILTPLVVKSVYQDLTSSEINDFLEKGPSDKEGALSFLKAIDLVCSLAIADGTPVEDLVLSEKRWVFRLVLGPAEHLILFRYEPNEDVEPVDEGDPILETA